MAGVLCTPTSVLVHTDEKDIPVVINSQQCFVLPTEKALKLAKAEVLNFKFSMNSKESASLSQPQNTQTTEYTYTLMETDIPAIKADLTHKDIQSITAYVPGD